MFIYMFFVITKVCRHAESHEAKSTFVGAGSGFVGKLVSLYFICAEMPKTCSNFDLIFDNDPNIS